MSSDLFRILRNSKTGCYIGQYYAGCYGYADDLFLLSPSRDGLQEMLTIAEKYDHNISILIWIGNPPSVLDCVDEYLPTFTNRN